MSPSMRRRRRAKLYAWVIGDGAYALRKMGQKSRGKNTIKGDNAGTFPLVPRRRASSVMTMSSLMREIKAGIEREKDHNAVLGLIEEYGGNFRTFGRRRRHMPRQMWTSTRRISRFRNGTGAEGHGDVKITSDAKSDIAPFNVNPWHRV